MRVRIRRRETLWRVVEADGEVVVRWLPLEPFQGALDRGGFDDRQDARSFALAIHQIRAEAGLLSGIEAA
ncbi:MAG: hypothetical protein JRG93_20560 [Deltaproteobacteria bacterium]|nr:hypothetical protein [Deltaproteobacteria bacterium]